MFFDIHAHILPSVDDGAADINEALQILQLMQQQGITHVIATPHFYPIEDTFEAYNERTQQAFRTLQYRLKKLPKLPKVSLGCELLYYEGIAEVSSLNDFCLNGSPFLLLELTDQCITPQLFNDLVSLRENSSITPIIAHIERYFRARQYKKFLSFLEENNIPVQINASSLQERYFNRVIKRILNSNLFCVLATDAHSVDERPPMISQALAIIEKRFGTEIKNKLVDNSKQLFDEIILNGD